MGGRRGGSKGSFQAPVVRDLGLQGLRGLLHGGDRCQHLRQVLLQQLAPLRGGAVPFAAQPRKVLHLPDGHLGLAQAQQESDPIQVRGRVAALAAGCPCHRRDQAGTLVVTQRVRGQTGAFGDFGDGQDRCHGNDPRRSSALEVKLQGPARSSGRIGIEW